MKLIGSVLIIATCGGVGFSMAASHRREERALRELYRVLDYMASELQYHLLPLPELCRRVAGESSGPVRQVMEALSQELESQIAPDAAACMTAALAKIQKLPQGLRKHMADLGVSLGRFDLEGQLRGLEAARRACATAIEALSENRDQRLRGYQTLGLCAGCALAILFL